MELDKFDEAILHHLAEDGRITSIALAERIGLSSSACHRRIKALEQCGHIVGYAAIISEEAYGATSTVFVAVTLDNQRRETLASFEQAVRCCPRISECHLMSGEFDYLLRVVVRSDDRYERLHQDVLSQLPGVRRLVSSFAIRPVLKRARARGDGALP
jgi:Lrp/AsnC family leucine-responsive transcriptional regulator